MNRKRLLVELKALIAELPDPQGAVPGTEEFELVAAKGILCAVVASIIGGQGMGLLGHMQPFVKTQIAAIRATQDN